MKALTFSRYGGPEVVKLTEIARPEITGTEVLVKVISGAVTTGDWRLRAAAFPGAFWLPGRLMFGLFRPRKRVLGNDFAGQVVAVGAEVSRFSIGDKVFGGAMLGAHAEYLAMPADGAIGHMPDGLTFEQAAALPFGGLTALEFLRDHARLKPGQNILILGASGGVGCYAVQIARAMGAKVTAVCSGDNLDFVTQLGADRVIDYTKDDFTRDKARYDVGLECGGFSTFGQCRPLLKRRGLFVPLTSGGSAVFLALFTRLFPGRRVIFGISGGSPEIVETLRKLVQDGQVRPVIDRRFDMSQAAQAYRFVEGRHRAGAVVLNIHSALAA